MNAKLTHPFFIGLVIIFISFFFTFYKIRPNQRQMEDYEEMRASSNISVSASMWDAAFANSPTINTGMDKRTRRSLGINEMMIANYFTIPKLFGINFLVILILVTWAAVNFIFNNNMTVSNRQMLTVGIGAAFLLFFVILIWDINYYRKVANDMGSFEGKVRDFVSFTPVFGFFLFVGGWLASMYGAFVQKRVY
jgi:hypothetical protein